MFRSNLTGSAEGLERCSARATLAVLIGITIEAGILVWFPQPHFWETVGTALAYTLIGAGLAAEYLVILRLSAVNQRASDEFAERLAELEACAAEANRRTLEVQLALQMLGQSTPALDQFVRTASGDISHVALPAIMPRGEDPGAEVRHAQ